MRSIGGSVECVPFGPTSRSVLRCHQTCRAVFRPLWTDFGPFSRHNRRCAAFTSRSDPLDSEPDRVDKVSPNNRRNMHCSTQSCFTTNGHGLVIHTTTAAGACSMPDQCAGGTCQLTKGLALTRVFGNLPGPHSASHACVSQLVSPPIIKWAACWLVVPQVIYLLSMCTGYMDPTASFFVCAYYRRHSVEPQAEKHCGRLVA